VLQVLADPGHPDLPAKLRFAASAITIHKRRDLPLWLQGGLLTHLLDIQRSLPRMGLDPTEAADICAAAAVTLCNIIRVARCPDSVSAAGSTTKDSVVAQVACPEALATVVQYGMLGPAAQEPLPPGREIPRVDCMPTYASAALSKASTAATEAVRHIQQLWTPLRLWGFLIVDLQLGMHELSFRAAPSERAALLEVKMVVGQLAREGVFRHLLMTVLQDVASSKQFGNCDVGLHTTALAAITFCPRGPMP
jgi:hypothetical protein